MKRFGFTMMELIIVIVIGGILAAVMIPRLERDPTREAANQIVRHIQYTQHLAMVDDVYDATKPTWTNDRWTIVFDAAGYTVSSQQGNVIVATDPGTQQLIDSNNAGKFSSFGVTVLLTGSCVTSKSLAFDNFGSPHVTASGAEIAAVCTITVSGDRTAVITVQPKTGYVHLDSVS